MQYVAAPYHFAPDYTNLASNPTTALGSMRSLIPIPTTTRIPGAFSSLHSHLLEALLSTFQDLRAATARLDAMTAVSRLVTARSTWWKRHQGIEFFLWLGRFGVGQLSVAHFFPISEEDHDSWNVDEKVSMDTFASVSQPQPLPRLDTIVDIIKCVCTLQHGFILYGSELLMNFIRRAVEFLEGVKTYLPGTLRLPSHVHIILAWTDQCFNDLFSACH